MEGGGYDNNYSDIRSKNSCAACMVTLADHPNRRRNANYELLEYHQEHEDSVCFYKHTIVDIVLNWNKYDRVSCFF